MPSHLNRVQVELDQAVELGRNVLLDVHIRAQPVVDIFDHAACPLDAAQYPVVCLFDGTKLRFLLQKPQPFSGGC